MKFKKGDRVVIQDRTSVNFGKHGTFLEYDTYFINSCRVQIDGIPDFWRYEECQLEYDYMDAREYAMEPFTMLSGTTYNLKDFEKLIKKENNEMELLNIYFDRKQKEVKEKYKEKDVKIRCKDPVYKELHDIAKKYEGVRGVICHTGCDFEFSDEIKKAIVKNDRDYDAQLDANYELKAEITAQLEVCETYEQKMNVLKSYGVVNANGILNK